MTDSPADPIAAEARRLVETLYVSTSDLSTASCEIAINVMADMVAAFGHRMKAAGRAEASAWKPISEAPKDGTPIDLWQNGERITDAYWSDVQDGWCVDGTYGREEPTPLAIIPAPTHFMRLPPPPEGGES